MGIPGFNKSHMAKGMKNPLKSKILAGFWRKGRMPVHGERPTYQAQQKTIGRKKKRKVIGRIGCTLTLVVFRCWGHKVSPISPSGPLSYCPTRRVAFSEMPLSSFRTRPSRTLMGCFSRTSLIVFCRCTRLPDKRNQPVFHLRLVFLISSQFVFQRFVLQRGPG